MATLRRRGSTMLAIMAAVVAASLIGMGQANAAVYFNDRAADAPIEPHGFGGGPGIAHEHELRPGEALWAPHFVQNLHWSAWGGAEATATGTVELLVPDSLASEPVAVTLGGLQMCDGVKLYTRYSLALPPGEPLPRSWQWVKEATFPCRVTFAGYYPTREAEEGCAVPISVDGSVVGTWHPRTPHFALCAPVWKHWGGQRVEGNAVVRYYDERQYPARVVLRRPEYCRNPAGISGEGEPGLNDGVFYTELVFTMYGRGEPEPTKRPFGISPSHARRLFSEIGHPGSKSRTFRETAPSVMGCRQNGRR